MGFIALPELDALNGVAAPKPKPPRVEKWQRWSDRYDTERMVTDVSDIRAIMKDADGKLVGIRPIGIRDHWTFLGYAKPDKVEVGQRWRSIYGNQRIEAVFGGGCELTNGLRFDHEQLLNGGSWEYLGMAESAPIDGSAVEAAVVVAARITRAIAKALPEADSGEIERLHAEIHADDKRVPITKKVDPKVEARRANEEAAKRLIENQPEWAYPKAWMCAVLAAQEYCNRDPRWPLALAIEDKSRGLMAVCRLAHDRKPQHVDVTEADRAAYDAYARGMERSSPMTRQGVKGGISTVDMGEYHE